jgi:hypothetical protein
VDVNLATVYCQFLHLRGCARPVFRVMPRRGVVSDDTPIRISIPLATSMHILLGIFLFWMLRLYMSIWVRDKDLLVTFVPVSIGIGIS